MSPGGGEPDDADGEVDEVGYVDGLDAPERLEGDGSDHKTYGSGYHGVAQGAGCRGTDKDAVPEEGEAADKWHRHQPRQEGMGVGYDAGVGGHQPHHTLARQGIEQGEGCADGKRPEEEDADGMAEVQAVARTDKRPVSASAA